MIKEVLEKQYRQLGLASTVETLAAFACANHYPVAIWRLPNSTESFLLIQTRPQLQYYLELTHANESGFAVSGFWASENGLLMLQPDLVFCFKAEGITVLQSTSSDAEALQRFIEEAPPSPDPSSLGWHQTEQESGSQATKDFFVQLVRDGIEEIKEGRLEKVVLSRFTEVNLQEETRLTTFWEALCQEYPNTFVSLVSVPGIGTWLGATPELLLEVKDQHLFRTVALAGTQKVLPGTGEGDVAWSQKEIEEQALVSRYIINCFKVIRLREYEEKGPRTITAGKVRHLQTTFTVDMAATERPDLPGQMLKLLHPTSAVGGMPREAALQFIGQHEQYNRQLYSGFLGPVNICHYTGLFVNLRCLQLVKQAVLLYAGAGITQDSNPEKEWIETELKTSVLQRVLEQLPNS